MGMLLHYLFTTNLTFLNAKDTTEDGKNMMDVKIEKAKKPDGYVTYKIKKQLKVNDIYFECLKKSGDSKDKKSSGKAAGGAATKGTDNKNTTNDPKNKNQTATKSGDNTNKTGTNKSSNNNSNNKDQTTSKATSNDSNKNTSGTSNSDNKDKSGNSDGKCSVTKSISKLTKSSETDPEKLSKNQYIVESKDGETTIKVGYPSYNDCELKILKMRGTETSSKDSKDGDKENKDNSTNKSNATDTNTQNQNPVVVENSGNDGNSTLYTAKKGVMIKDDKLVSQSQEDFEDGKDADDSSSIWSKWWFWLIIVLIIILIIWMVYF